MKDYRNFSIATYMYAYYAARATDEEIRSSMERYLAYLPLKKVYIENHRATTDVPVERLRQIRAIVEEYGVTASGGITRTGPGAAWASSAWRPPAWSREAVSPPPSWVCGRTGRSPDTRPSPTPAMPGGP